jgi:hypothetical protein
MLNDSLRSDPEPINCRFVTSLSGPDDYAAMKQESSLTFARRYILIITSDAPPSASYVQYFYDGRWYYIDKADQISKRNFVLLTALLIVQATAAPPLPIAPTINLNPS